jgi:hypothetical protein
MRGATTQLPPYVFMTWCLVKHRDNFNFYTCHSFLIQLSRDSSVGIATGYGLDDRTIGVRFPVGAGNCSLRHRVQTGSGAHPASYPMGIGNSFTGSKAAGA